MIGSRQGWVEAPYVACPGDWPRWPARSRARPAARWRSSRARAASTRRRAGRDARRGDADPRRPRRDDAPVLAVLPGTHSKWALVERGRLHRDFATFMTGELYAVLLEHSILGRMADRTQSRCRRRGSGVRARRRARARPARIVARYLRRAHAGATGELAPAASPTGCPALLIGREIRAARALGAAAARPTMRRRHAGRRRRARRALRGRARAGGHRRGAGPAMPPRAACFASRGSAGIVR